jgi:hypothetical protein
VVPEQVNQKIVNDQRLILELIVIYSEIFKLKHLFLNFSPSSFPVRESEGCSCPAVQVLYDESLFWAHNRSPKYYFSNLFESEFENFFSSVGQLDNHNIYIIPSAL